MYPHFIEVHDLNFYYPILVNIDCINKIYLDGNDDMTDTWTLIIMEHGNLSVLETYEEVKRLIEDAGCSIKQKDLDTSNPITKQMIMSEDMVGEPVWNSNNGRWYQIANWSNYEDQFYMELQGIWEILKYTDKELKKFPLYRMKQ